MDRLEARSLVIRLPDAEDRRKLLVDLTAEGREVASRNLAAAAAITQETLAPLTADECDLLYALLAKLV